MLISSPNSAFLAGVSLSGMELPKVIVVLKQAVKQQHIAFRAW